MALELMSDGIATGLLGGLFAALLTAVVARRAERGGEPGILKYGSFLLWLGIGGVFLGLFPVIQTFVYGNEKEPIARLLLIVFSFGSAIYCFFEALFVNGRFDKEGIEFHSPWTGRKVGKWRDLKSVKLNDFWGWYTLDFGGGNKIRMSRFLINHRAALELGGYDDEF
jgi:hypothetical protein